MVAQNEGDHKGGNPTTYKIKPYVSFLLRRKKLTSFLIELEKNFCAYAQRSCTFEPRMKNFKNHFMLENISDFIIISSMKWGMCYPSVYLYEFI